MTFTITYTITNASGESVTSTIDMTDYIAYKGIKWQRADVESQNAGRTLDGTLIRGVQATKIRLDITCRPLTSSEASAVLTAISPKTVLVTYTDPMKGANRTGVEMYANNNPATFLMRKQTGTDEQGQPIYTEYWNGITFPLIEV